NEVICIDNRVPAPHAVRLSGAFRGRTNMSRFLFAALVALATVARADDVMLDDGRRIAVDPEMVFVSSPDARPGLFIVYGMDGSKSIESVGLSGCVPGRGDIAQGPPGDPSMRGVWFADGQRPFDLMGRVMCGQKTSGAKFLELFRKRKKLEPALL